MLPTINNLDDFVVFIITNGRPKNVKTYKTLRRCGYTGRIILLIDNVDKKKNEYLQEYKDEVIVFNKQDVADRTDSANNFNDFRGIIYGRNACFEVAKALSIKYFIQLDDDYTGFIYRFDNNKKYFPPSLPIRSLDKIFISLVNFLIKTPTTTIAITQGGDFIGGQFSPLAEQIKLIRKAMNSFVCSTDKAFKFIGQINEDVNAYTSLAQKGVLFFSTNQVSLSQMQTQQNSGGMTEVYLDSGTYIKSFYSVMFSPSSVKVKMLQCKNPRLHHSISWRHTTPVILSEEYKKK